METIEILREEVKEYVETADPATLRMVYAIFEAKQENDWWDELPSDVQDEIDVAITELDRGNFVSHEEVKKMHPKWFIK